MINFKLKNENFVAVVKYNEESQVCNYSVFLILNSYSDYCDFSRIKSGEEIPKSKVILYHAIINHEFSSPDVDTARKEVLNCLNNCGEVVVNNSENNFTIDYYWNGVSVARDMYIEVKDEHYLMISTELSKDVYCIKFDPEFNFWYGTNMHTIVRITGEKC